MFPATTVSEKKGSSGHSVVLSVRKLTNAPIIVTAKIVLSCYANGVAVTHVTIAMSKCVQPVATKIQQARGKNVVPTVSTNTN